MVIGGIICRTELGFNILCKGEHRMSGKITPDKVAEWIEQQSDLTPQEKEELEVELESYFIQRQKRIDAMKSNTVVPIRSKKS